ncbi:MAG: ABC transporter substrate-binding protein [Candidatus Omnitrophica bacterium]|nr:ABC transporter substrate-binding protein [Candidatus Omnitrophota bacterium]
MKIVSLSPSLTEILVYLGALADLAGATDLCEANGSLERVGSPKALEISKIQRLEPDWILADTRDNRPEEIQVLQKRGRVKVFDVSQLSEVRDGISELGRLTEKQEGARRLNQGILEEIAKSEAAFRDRPRRRTLLLLWDKPFLTVNFDSYPSRLIESSGGENVFRQEPLREFPVEIEDMIEKNPETLLLATAPFPFERRHVARLRQFRVLSRIPIHLTEGKFFCRYGVQTVHALKALRKIFEALP